MSSDETRRGESVVDRDDPAEEPTQPMATRSSDTHVESESDFERSGTTTWGASIAAPVIVVGEESFEEAGDINEDSDVEDEGILEEETIVAVPSQEPSPSAPLAPSSSLHPMLLERIEPSLGRGERLRLDASHWKVSLGRAEESDVRLYTASASREHAVIAGNEAGEWVLTLVAGKSVSIDGESTTEPVVLEVGMNIILGQDHLRCVTEGLARGEMIAPTAADTFKDPVDPRFRVLRRLGVGWWTIGIIAAIGIGLILFAWLTE